MTSKPTHASLSLSLLLRVLLLSVVLHSRPTYSNACEPTGKACSECPVGIEKECHLCELGKNIYSCGSKCPGDLHQTFDYKCTNEELVGVVTTSSTYLGCPLSANRRFCERGGDVLCFDTDKTCADIDVEPKFVERKCVRPEEYKRCNMCSLNFCTTCKAGNLGFYCTKANACPTGMKPALWGDRNGDDCYGAMHRIIDAPATGCEVSCSSGDGMNFCIEHAQTCSTFGLLPPSCSATTPQPATCACWVGCKTCTVGKAGYHCADACVGGSVEGACTKDHVNRATTGKPGHSCAGKRCRNNADGAWCFPGVSKNATCESLGLEEDVADLCTGSSSCDQCVAGGCVVCKYENMSVCKPAGTSCADVQMAGMNTTASDDCKGINGTYLGDVPCADTTANKCNVGGKDVCVKEGCSDISGSVVVSCALSFVAVVVSMVAVA